MLRELLDGRHPQLELVAVNDLAPIENLAYLLQYDSVHGRSPQPPVVDGDSLRIGDRAVRVLSIADPAALPWGDLGVEVVIESTGAFTARDAAAGHLRAGARRVLIGAPAPDADLTVVLGVNHARFDPAVHHIVSNASCTTNSLAPPLKVLHAAFGIHHVHATTIHAYTASQAMVDRPARKWHRGRAAAVNIIPTTTGADAATVQVLPELAGRIRAMAVRVPVPDGALTDITAQLDRDVDADAINAAMRSAAAGELAGILAVSSAQLVSSDIIGDPHSGTVHAAATSVSGRLAKVLVWYDNEYAYARRCLDVVDQLPL